MADRSDALQAVRAIAYRQSGYVTAAQALGVGLSHQAQKYHADQGTWSRVERGIYRLRDWPSDIEERQAYRVTTPSRTLLDLAADDAGQEAIDVSVSDALDRGLTSASRLRRRADEFGVRAALRIERALAGSAV